MANSAALDSARIEVDLDPRRFNQKILEMGWGDGLPCIPPTEPLVLEYLAETTRSPGDIVAALPPSGADCTVEKIAINAVMAGAPPTAMPLLCAVVEAMADAEFFLAGINATTASVVPAVVVNGPIRHQLKIPFSYSCLGGMTSCAPSVGRATRLILRHVAGQVAGVTSESVFGQPARVIGLVTGEWEERSPWAPLAERRGVPGDAVTVLGAMGTTNVVDTLQVSAQHLLHLIGGSAGYMGANGLYLHNNTFSQFTVALNPSWAYIIGKEFPSMEEVRRILWERASLPIDAFPPATREMIERDERVQSDGRVHQVRSPDDINVFVCGGEGALHATLLPGFTSSLAVTRPITG
ncbi:MAG TPA: hypothetical protein VGG38_16630 [Acidimicrobiales bacterium]|jgi:hypothetical protein